MLELSRLLRETLERAREINARAGERREQGADSHSTELAILLFEQRA